MGNRKKISFIIALICIFYVSCTRANSDNSTQSFPLYSGYIVPDIPISISDSCDRKTYLAFHFWDNYDFKDSLSRKNVGEQVFVDYIKILNSCKSDARDKAIYHLLDKSFEADSLAFVFITKLAEKYLYDPNSRFRNEELYIPVLQYIVNSNKIDKLDKIRPRMRLDLALKNRVGQLANDFFFVTKAGEKKRLKNIAADYVLLFFNNPECEDCQRVKKYISESDFFSNIPSSRLTVVSIYPDEDIEMWMKTPYPKEWISGYDVEQTLISKNIYDLKAIPTMYLLDANKVVLLKDVSIEKIEEYLKEILK